MASIYNPTYGGAYQGTPFDAVKPSAPDPSAPPYTPTPTASAPVPTPAPTVPADHVTVPGFTPDWQSLITSDPAYLGASANATKAQGDAAAQRKQALQDAVLRYGGLPTGYVDQYGDIGKDTLDSASQNQYSTLANLMRNYGQSENQLRQQLAARGALQSGDLNFGEGQLQQQYGQQRYDAANAFGSQVNNALQAYTGVLGSNAQNLSGALSSAEANVYSNPGYTSTPDTTANHDAANSSTYGQPIYVDSSGNLFDQNGNPFLSPAQSTPAPTSAPATAPAPSGGNPTMASPAMASTSAYGTPPPAPPFGVGTYE